MIFYPCHGQGGAQVMMLTRNKEIRLISNNFGTCVDRSPEGKIVQWDCHSSKNQLWIYDEINQMVRSDEDDFKKASCFTIVNPDHSQFVTAQYKPCDANNPDQKFPLKIVPRPTRS